MKTKLIVIATILIISAVVGGYYFYKKQDLASDYGGCIGPDGPCPINIK